MTKDTENVIKKGIATQPLHEKAAVYLEICTILVSPILTFSAVVEGKSYTLII